MPPTNLPPSSQNLRGAAAFEMFVWLQEPYADIAAASDFPSLSGFEKWERLSAYILKVSYLLSKNKLTAFDEVTNESKMQLLQWLDEGYRRARAVPQQKPAPNRRPLFSRA